MKFLAQKLQYLKDIFWPWDQVYIPKTKNYWTQVYKCSKYKSNFQHFRSWQLCFHTPFHNHFNRPEGKPPFLCKLYFSKRCGVFQFVMIYLLVNNVLEEKHHPQGFWRCLKRRTEWSDHDLRCFWLLQLGPFHAWAVIWNCSFHPVKLYGIFGREKMRGEADISIWNIWTQIKRKAKLTALKGPPMPLNLLCSAVYLNPLRLPRK